jgi:Ran GTPase-activating protein (RanGAP) involved in mRNA processing and transport
MTYSAMLRPLSNFIVMDICNRVYPIEFLDISDNKSSKLTQGQLYYLAEVTKTLRTVRMANIGVDLDIIKRTLEQLFLNKNLKELYLDISRNNIGAEGALTLVDVFKYGQCIKALNIADNNLGEKGTVEIIRSLPVTLERLILDRNFTNRAETLEFTAALGSWVATHPNCSVLSIQGDGRSKIIGTALTKFFVDLAKNGSLEELDITANSMGDHAFSDLCRSLRSNDGLKSIRCDKNGISYSGYRAFVYMLKSNKTLSYLEPPTRDQQSLQDKTGDLFSETIFEINHILAQRRPIGTSPFRPDPFLFDLRWSSPECDPPGRLDVPNELFDISNSVRKELAVEDLVLPPVLSSTDSSRLLLTSSAPAPSIPSSPSSSNPPLLSSSSQSNLSVGLASSSSTNSLSYSSPPSLPPPPFEGKTRVRAPTKTAGGHMARAFTEQTHEGMLDEVEVS